MKKRPRPNCRSRTLVREKFSRLSASRFPPCSQAVRPAPNAQPLSCQAVPQKLPPATKGKVRLTSNHQKEFRRLRSIKVPTVVFYVWCVGIELLLGLLRFANTFQVDDTWSTGKRNPMLYRN